MNEKTETSVGRFKQGFHMAAVVDVWFVEASHAPVTDQDATTLCSGAMSVLP